MGNLNFQDVIRDVHNPAQHALQTTASLSASTVFIGNPTLYAVVNTTAGGQASVVLDTGTKNIGSVSVLGGSVGLNAGVNGIGFVTAAISTPTLFAVVNTGAAGVGNSIVTVANPNFGINAGVNSIGFATTVLGNLERAEDAGHTTGDKGVMALGVYVANNPAQLAGTDKDYSPLITDDSGQLYVNVNGSGGINVNTVTSITDPVALGAGVAGIGFATINQVNQPALVSGGAFIGLVTAVTRNAGTNKTLVSLPVAMSTSSLATIAVPTNANTMYVTNLLLNSDATVRVNILSGVTYLNGNASIGVTLNPGGGWVETGSPDSPTYIGNPSGAIVIQKFDMTGTSAKIAGKVVYFQE